MLRDDLMHHQGGKCAICGRSAHTISEHQLVIDHDHQTGHVRGLLCRSCNIRLSGIEDATWAALAVAYLAQNYSQVQVVTYVLGKR